MSGRFAPLWFGESSKACDESKRELSLWSPRSGTKPDAPVTVFVLMCLHGGTKVHLGHLPFYLQERVKFIIILAYSRSFCFYIRLKASGSILSATLRILSYRVIDISSSNAIELSIIWALMSPGLSKTVPPWSWFRILSAKFSASVDGWAYKSYISSWSICFWCLDISSSSYFSFS